MFLAGGVICRQFATHVDLKIKKTLYTKAAHCFQFSPFLENFSVIFTYPSCGPSKVTQHSFSLLAPVSVYGRMEKKFLFHSLPPVSFFFSLNPRKRIGQCYRLWCMFCNQFRFFLILLLSYNCLCHNIIHHHQLPH